MGPVDRFAGLAGIVGAALILACAGIAAADANPDDSDAVVTAAVDSNRDSARLAAYLGLLGVVVFAIFTARLYTVLRAQSADRAWISVMPLLGGGLLMGAAVIEIGLAYAASEFSSSGDSSALARFFVLWGWNSANIYAPGFAALILGGTGAQSAGGFPPWFRAVSWTLLGLSALLVLVARAPGLGAAPGILWVSIASVLLTFGRDRATVDGGVLQPR